MSKSTESTFSEFQSCKTRSLRAQCTNPTETFRRMFFVANPGLNSQKYQKRTRILKFESLEERLVLNTAPILQGLPEMIYLTPGMSYHVALDGYDKDGDDLTFEVEATNQLFTASVLEGNRSVKFSVYEEQTQGAKDWVYVGDIIFELFEEEAPITTARIMEIINGTPLVNSSGQYIDKNGTVVDTPVIVSYDGVALHRIIDGFMLQGGDVRYGNGYGGTGVTFADEYSDLLQHSSRGIVSTANSNSESENRYNTNDSQFFITDNSTPHLDGKHNVFGFVTEGDELRKAINAVSTSTSDLPLYALKTDNFEIFNDTENGTLRLVVPEDATEGESEVTVWVSDGVNDPVAYTFTVKVIPEVTSQPTTWPLAGSVLTTDGAYDYQKDIVAGETITITLPEYAVPGEVEYYVTFLDAYSNELNVEATIDGNTLTIKAPENGGGIARFIIGANAKDGDSTKSGNFGNVAQYLTLFVIPSAPTVKLAEIADTGTKGDNVTSRNNSAEGNELIFEISNVLELATVTLYESGREVDATLISSAKQDNGLWTWTVKTDITDDTVALSDGTYSFYAVQTYTPPSGSGHSAMESRDSARLSVVVNTKAPTFISPTENDIFDAEVGTKLTISFQTENQVANATKFTISSVKDVNGNTVDIPNGVEINETTGLFSWTPTSGQANDYTFLITATTGAGFSATKTVEIVFQAGPDFEVNGSTSLQEGDEFELELRLTDNTFEGAVEFSIQEGSLPDSANYTLEKTGEHSAVFRWITTEAHGPATYNPVFIVTDEEGNVRKKDVTLTVGEIDQPPIFTNNFERVYALKEGEPFSLQLRATDADIYPDRNNVLVYSLHGSYPDGVKLDSNTGLLTWTPDESCGNFSFEITVRATDETGLFAEQKLNFFVEETDQAPVFEKGESSFQNDTGQTFSTKVMAKDPDYHIDPNVPINQVVYSLEGEDIPEGMTINPNTGEVSWAIPADYLGDALLGTVYAVVFAYEVHSSGNMGLSSSKAITIELTNKALMDALADVRNQDVGNRAKEIADRLNGMLTSDSFWMLQGGNVPGSGYVPAIDYGHSSYNGFGGSLNPYAIGIDGTSGEVESKDKKDKESDSEAEENQNPNQQRKTAVNFQEDLLLENTLHEHDVFAEKAQTDQVVKSSTSEPQNHPSNVAISQVQYEYIADAAYGTSNEFDDIDLYFDELQKANEEPIVENTPDMEDAIDMIIALRP